MNSTIGRLFLSAPIPCSWWIRSKTRSAVRSSLILLTPKRDIAPNTWFMWRMASTDTPSSSVLLCHLKSTKCLRVALVNSTNDSSN